MKEIVDDYEYWQGLSVYESEVISVFAKENVLTEYLLGLKNKEKLKLIDLGCGSGASFKYLSGFKEVVAVDFSGNMLSKAKNIGYQLNNITYKRANIYRDKVGTADIVMSVCSIMPKNNFEIEPILKNVIGHVSKPGKLLLVIPSFEAQTIFHHYKMDYLIRSGCDLEKANLHMSKHLEDQNYSPFGYLITDKGMIQKHWLKEEAYNHLSKFGASRISIEKLELDWTSQLINCSNYKGYPNYWFWFVVCEFS